MLNCGELLKNGEEESEFLDINVELWRIIAELRRKDLQDKTQNWEMKM